jgi:hypothetical protein
MKTIVLCSFVSLALAAVGCANPTEDVTSGAASAEKIETKQLVAQGSCTVSSFADAEAAIGRLPAAEQNAAVADLYGRKLLSNSEANPTTALTTPFEHGYGSAKMVRAYQVSFSPPMNQEAGSLMVVAGLDAAPEAANGTPSLGQVGFSNANTVIDADGSVHLSQAAEEDAFGVLLPAVKLDTSKLTVAEANGVRIAEGVTGVLSIGEGKSTQKIGVLCTLAVGIPDSAK